jgi:hypothetical protein
LEYVQLADRPMLEAADCILSTSAIADVLGTVKERPTGLEEEDFVLSSMRAEFYDPGLVDNTPIAPLLENEECDLIFVIFLDQKIKDSSEYLRTELSQINDRIRRLNPDLDDETYGSLKSRRFLRPVRTAPSKILHAQVISLIPSKDLGHGVIGFLRETVWFREKRIIELIKLGFEDTRRALDDFFDRSRAEISNRVP